MKMKNQKTNLKTVKAVTFFLLLIIISCSTYKGVKIANTEIEANFNNSLKKWKTLKKSHNDSYEYEVSLSSWVGFRNTTKLVVRKGKLVSREYLETQRNKNDRFADEETLIYKEEGADINKNEKGFKGVLIDQVYNKCGTESLQVDEKENNLYFSINEMGIIKSCGYSPKNCADDCSRGIYISSFKWLE